MWEGGGEGVEEVEVGADEDGGGVMAWDGDGDVIQIGGVGCRLSRSDAYGDGEGWAFGLVEWVLLVSFGGGYTGGEIGIVWRFLGFPAMYQDLFHFGGAGWAAALAREF